VQLQEPLQLFCTTGYGMLGAQNDVSHAFGPQFSVVPIPQASIAHFKRHGPAPQLRVVPTQAFCALQSISQRWLPVQVKVFPAHDVLSLH
jgi:hypothetical protein